MVAIKIEQQTKTKKFNIFGKISKYAVIDNMLLCDAKALYALLCTYGAFSGIITVSVKTLCKDLNIGKKKLCELLFELNTQGYIEIIKSKSEGQFVKHTYKIVACPEKYYDMLAEDSKEQYALDRIRTGGIQSYGYGLAEQRVLRDAKLHITAKAIYVYFCAFSGNTSTAYPSVQAVLKGLNICESTYYKYIKQLLDKGYVQIIEHKTLDGRYSPNEYVLLEHPNSHKPSNYEANIAAVNEKIQKRRDAKATQKDNSPSPKSDARNKMEKGAETDVNTSSPSPKSDTRSVNKKGTENVVISSLPYPKSDTHHSDKQCPETCVNAGHCPSFTAPSGQTQSPSEPFRIEPSTTSPSPIFDTLNTNTLNSNNHKKNTLYQENPKILEENIFSAGINQSLSKKSEKSDSIDSTVNNIFSLNPDKIYQDMMAHNGIPLSYLNNKPALDFIIKTASENAESSVSPISEDLKAILRKSGVPFSDNSPNDSPFCRFSLKCLTDMLYDSGNFNKKYSPDAVAAFLNTHIKLSDGIISFDNWLEKFEKSFMLSASKPEVSKNIKNPFAYVKTSLWKFLSNYHDFSF